MSDNEQKILTSRKFLPAVLKQNSNGWHIEYYAYNNEVHSLERKRIKVNMLRKKARTFAEFRSMATQMIIEINCKLAEGWSPFTLYEGQPKYMVTAVKEVQNTIPITLECSVPADLPEPHPQEQDTPSAPTSPFLVDVLSDFIRIKGKELSAGTMRSYSSFCNNLKAWVNKYHVGIACGDFSQRLANEYLDYVFEGNNSNDEKRNRNRISDDHVSPRTYNNNLKIGRAVFNWALSHCYCESNPFEKIQVKREQQKQRTIIPADARQQVLSYFRQNNPQFEIICRLVFTSLIRPIEISRLKVSMINFEKHCIELPSDSTKNHKSRNSRIDEELETLLRKHIEGANGDDYLFADKVWKCGRTPMSSHSFTLVWTKMRNDLGLPKEYQLYSLRDSGINGMLRAGVADLDVMQAAGHSDLKMTTRYANHIDTNLINRLNEKAPDF